MVKGKMNCINCKKEYEAKRSDSKYCSIRCRVASSRNVTLNNVTDNKRINVTDNVTPKRTDNIPEQYKTICEICNKPYIDHDQCFTTTDKGLIRTSMPYHYWSINLSKMEVVEHY